MKIFTFFLFLKVISKRTPRTLYIVLDNKTFLSVCLQHHLHCHFLFKGYDFKKLHVMLIQKKRFYLLGSFLPIFFTEYIKDWAIFNTKTWLVKNRCHKSNGSLQFAFVCLLSWILSHIDTVSGLWRLPTLLHAGRISHVPLRALLHIPTGTGVEPSRWIVSSHERIQSPQWDSNP
jgi:hypothetical protein